MTLAVSQAIRVKLDQSELKSAYPETGKTRGLLVPTFVDAKSTSVETVLLTKDGYCFTLSHKDASIEDPKSLRLSHIKKLSHIERIAAGSNHFLALKKIIRLAFAEWTPTMIHDWLEETQLAFVKNVIKFGKIDGKTLLNAPDDFYEKTLGIMDENKAYKLKHMIESLKDECVLEVTLYGWGDNNFSQLGIYGPKHVYHPVELDIPECFKVTTEQKDKAN